MKYVFLIFVSPLLRMGGFVKYAVHFLMETQVIAFVDKPGKLGKHPSARFSHHLNSNRHKLSVKNKQCFKEMFNRNANVWQMTLNASLQSDKNKPQNNCFILKFLMIKKNWGHSHNLEIL